MQFYIRQNNPYTVAGHTVKGTIYFQIGVIYEESEVRLKFEGKEYAKVLDMSYIVPDQSNPYKIPQEQKVIANDIDISHDQQSILDMDQTYKPKNINYISDAPGQVMKRIKRNYGSKVIADSEFKVFKGKLLPGQYKFNFEFPTSNGWPSSFYWHSETNLQKQIAKVAYQVKFKVEDKKNKNQQVILGSQEIIINQFGISQQIEREISGDIVTYCCCMKGTTRMKVQLPKNQFLPGEDLVIRCEVDNSRCQKEIEYVQVRMQNKFTLIDESGYEKSIQNQFFLQNFDHVEAGQSRVGDKAIQLRIKISQVNYLPSTFGEHIQSKNYLQIEAFAGLSNTQPSKPLIQIPIILFNGSWNQQDMSVQWKEAKELDYNGNFIDNLNSNNFNINIGGYNINPNQALNQMQQQMKMVGLGKF